MKSVVPTVYLNAESDEAEFQKRVHLQQFQDEIADEGSRDFQRDLERLKESLEADFVAPLQHQAKHLCAHPWLRNVRIDRDSPLSFLPLNSVLLGSSPLLRALPFDQRKRHFSNFACKESKISCRILIIRDPSESLLHESSEIAWISQENSVGSTTVMTLSELLKERKSEELSEYDIVHFIGHHSIANDGGVVSNIPTSSGHVRANVLWEAFRSTKCKLIFLSACGTSSTFFTDRNARSDAFASSVRSKLDAT